MDSDLAADGDRGTLAGGAEHVSTVEIVSAAIALMSTAAAILAWLAKLRWSKEYRDAKEGEIAALKTQIEVLEALSSGKILEHARNTKVGLEEIIAAKEQEVAELNRVIATRVEQQTEVAETQPRDESADGVRWRREATEQLQRELAARKQAQIEALELRIEQARRATVDLKNLSRLVKLVEGQVESKRQRILAYERLPKGAVGAPLPTRKRRSEGSRNRYPISVQHFPIWNSKPRNSRLSSRN